MTMMPANTSCAMMRTALTVPSSRTSPYMPDTTYATASPTVMSTPSSFCAPSSRSRSALTLLSTSMILDPTSSCITMELVTIGLMPSSMQVPRLDAMMTRAQ
jgi:hypothetical protein